MKDHILNLYRIDNLSELDFSYKLIDFDLSFIAGKEELLNKQLQKIAEEVSSVTKGPTAVLKRNQRFFVAVPADKQMEDRSIDGIPFSIPIKLLPEVYRIDSKDIQGHQLDVVYKFLDYEIRRQLGQHRDLWKLNTHQFFLRDPMKGIQGSINVFEGFTYKLARLADGHFYVTLDLSTKYIDKYCLSHYINEGNVRTFENNYKGRRFLYLNGDNWYTIELLGFGKSVKEQDFIREGTTYNVLNYITEKIEHSRTDLKRYVKPNDLSMSYTYPGRTMDPHSGATSLARMLYNTKDERVKSLHYLSIKGPSKRFEAINNYISSYFKNLKFNAGKLLISNEPLVEKIKNFWIPELLFNNNRRLKITGFNSGMRDFAYQRKQLIKNNGVLNRTSFDVQYLLVPDEQYMDANLVEGFKNNAEFLIKKLAPAFDKFIIIRYPVKSCTSASVQIQEIEKVLHRRNALHGFALVVLPDLDAFSPAFLKTFHELLKSKFYPDLKVQCASAHNISSFFKPFSTAGNNGIVEYRVVEALKGRFSSYLFYLVLEHLIVNRKWPYALAKNLFYDIYIGIDVHDRHAGFTFFFKNGEQIIFHPEEVPQKTNSQRVEKVRAKTLNKVIYEKLKLYIPLYAPNPNGIVIVRDGRSFGVEYKALQGAINTLAAEGIVNKDTVKYGVVDLHKQSSVPIRIAAKTNSYDKLENPVAGSYKLVSPKEGFIFSTGYPFDIKGTSRPLNLSMKEGDLDFMKVMEDVFCQIMLAFSAPDKSNFLPVIIKLIDTLLEPLTATRETADEDEEDEEEMMDIN
ncbi:argonaute/piwi family protein [Mucilaginibacter polytrichastri]|uniref:Piwi domain-containing protein n=1 Tax=Mucilaginibacter polytrichastri TaxID=1302689 RepID=A0A1Q5ZS75_9SPHI|nr:hypothetical protein [Mucilaginibacter polytrichastri]OKS84593.1 hypothetical protein RG47T_0025 [Mucilaginibacter polytrichastri]SFT02560.1 hypothetical protein SAMN04487890_108210 [Mucilaginibacter polytrichastri]